MRDYLYFWHEPKNQCVVTSGIEFKDVATHMGRSGGLLLLRHRCKAHSMDFAFGFDCAAGAELEQLCHEDIYSWGDIRWADYAHPNHPPDRMTKQDVAEVLYFGHCGEPFANIPIPSLNNRFLASGHDDGWYLKIYYSAWSNMAELLSQLKWNWSAEARARILAGVQCAVWIDTSGMTDEAATHDIDSVMSRCLRRSSEVTP